MRLVQRRQEEARDQLAARRRADELDGGAHHVGRGVHGARDRAIHLALGDQHVGKDQRLLDFGLGLFGGHALVLAALDETLGQRGGLGIGGGIAQREPLQRQPFLPGTGLDGRPAADQRDVRHAPLQGLDAGTQHPRVIGLAQHDVPVERTGALLDALQQGRQGEVRGIGECGHGVTSAVKTKERPYYCSPCPPAPMVLPRNTPGYPPGKGLSPTPVRRNPGTSPDTAPVSTAHRGGTGRPAHGCT